MIAYREPALLLLIAVMCACYALHLLPENTGWGVRGIGAWVLINGIAAVVRVERSRCQCCGRISKQ